MSLDIWTCTVYIHVLVLVKPLQCRSQFNWDLQICMTTQLMRFVIRSTWTLQWLFILCPSIAVMLHAYGILLAIYCIMANTSNIACELVCSLFQKVYSMLFSFILFYLLSFWLLIDYNNDHISNPDLWQIILFYL